MTITTINELNNAIPVTLFGSKAAFNAAFSNTVSLWAIAGAPGQGVAPTATPSVPNSATLGCFRIPSASGSTKMYLSELSAISTTNNSQTIEIHDRLAHRAGLVGNVTTAQTVGFDLSTLLTTNNLSERMGESNYSDVQWWLEIYADVGTTVSTVTLNVTYNDGTTGNLNTFTIGSTGNRLPARIFSLNFLVPAADSGKYIRGINTMTLSASAGAAGNIGFTATRYRAGIFLEEINTPFSRGWAEIGLPEIYNDSCLFMIAIVSATSVQPLICKATLISG